MLDLTTAAFTCNYMHTLVDKPSKKMPNFPFFRSHKVKKQQLKTNIFNFCVHYSFNV